MKLTIVGEKENCQGITTAQVNTKNKEACHQTFARTLRRADKKTRRVYRLSASFILPVSSSSTDSESVRNAVREQEEWGVPGSANISPSLTSITLNVDSSKILSSLQPLLYLCVSKRYSQENLTHQNHPRPLTLLAQD